MGSGDEGGGGGGGGLCREEGALSLQQAIIIGIGKQYRSR